MPTQEVDLAVPPAALLHGWASEPHTVLFDGGGPRSWNRGEARFAARPGATLSLYGDGRALLRHGSGIEELRGDPFDLLDLFRQRFASSSGMIAVALSYDLSRLLERLRVTRRPGAEELVLFAAAYDWFLSYSYAEQRYRLSLHADGVERKQLVAELRSRAAGAACRRRGGADHVPVPEQPKERHLDAVRQALAHIRAGDIYQVNLAQRFSTSHSSSPADAFVELQRSHPMPFAAYFDCGELVLVCNSPECMLERDGDQIATYPIKGTRPRGRDPAGDRAMIESLRQDPKERAEHVMIVDLERNDLGRVCVTGSVRVDELMRVESFGTLHHLVSRVGGRLPSGTSMATVLRATFPGGSVTGAPKIRAIEIIDELEPVERGFYTGAIGYLCGDQAMFNITIRTAIVRGGRLFYYAGGGIVADSDPEREYEETLLKAQPLLSLLTASAA